MQESIRELALRARKAAAGCAERAQTLKSRRATLRWASAIVGLTAAVMFGFPGVGEFLGTWAKPSAEFLAAAMLIFVPLYFVLIEEEAPEAYHIYADYLGHYEKQLTQLLIDTTAWESEVHFKVLREIVNKNINYVQVNWPKISSM